MPNIGVVLKTEIARLSKKTVKTFVQPLHSSVAAQRRSLAAMKRQIAALEKEIAQLRKAGGKAAGASRAADTDGDQSGAPLRFQARGLRSLRSRLGLSAEDFGRLIGVSGQSVYNWESEKTVPRRSQLQSLAKLRGLGKRQVSKLLAEQAG